MLQCGAQQWHAKVAQLVEHSTENAGVVGSIPSLGTSRFWVCEACPQKRLALRVLTFAKDAVVGTPLFCYLQPYCITIQH